MAVTIETNPKTYLTSDNPIVWEFSSDNTGEVNFSFVVDLIIGGQINSRHFIFPERGNKAHFNASQIVKSEVAAPTVNYSSIAETLGSYERVAILVSEKFGEPATVQNTLGSSDVYAHKGRVDDLDFIDLDIPTNNYWLTDFPTGSQYMVGYNEELFLFVNNNNVADTITIELFDISGGSIASDTTNLIAQEYNRLNLKPSFVVANTTLTEANFDNAYRMVISTSAAGKGTREFYLDNTCSLYDSKRFIFLSRLGALESFTANKLNRLTTEGTDKSYSKQFGAWDSSNNWVYERTNGRQISYSTDSKDNLLVNSDFISEEKQNWLVKNLLESPLVFLQDSDGLRRVNVKSRGYESKQRVNDRLFNQVIEVSYSNTRKSALI